MPGEQQTLTKDRLIVLLGAAVLGLGGGTGSSIFFRQPDDFTDSRIARLEEDVRALSAAHVPKGEHEQRVKFNDLEHSQLRRADEVMTEDIGSLEERIRELERGTQ